ncbi:MAG: EcsC family protein [Thermoanaerobaculia bacterium]
MTVALAMTMGKAKRFKRRADRLLEDVFRAMFEEIDMEKIRHDIEEMRSASEDYQPKEHARTLTRRTALRCAAAGAVTGLPSGLFAIGTMGADLAYLVYQQFRLIVGIAAIYGHQPSGREQFTEALSCLAYSSGVGLGKQGLATVLESATIEGGIVADRIGMRFARERLTKFVPFVGAVSGGVLNYAAVRAVGRAAVRFYESRTEETLAEEIWTEGDREHA